MAARSPRRYSDPLRRRLPQLRCLPLLHRLLPVVLPNSINGFATGFIFVPLTAITMCKLRKEEIGNATEIYNLVHNIGGSGWPQNLR